MESAQTMMRAGDAFLPWMTDLLVEVVQTMISATGRAVSLGMNGCCFMSSLIAKPDRSGGTIKITAFSK